MTKTRRRPKNAFSLYCERNRKNALAAEDKDNIKGVFKYLISDFIVFAEQCPDVIEGEIIVNWIDEWVEKNFELLGEDDD